jgi:SIR2-like domain
VRERCGCACPSLIGVGTIGKNALVAYDWLIHDPDGQHVDDLRSQIGKDSASVLIFLGAGLSFGVGRFLGRASFERPSPWDDDRFPSWPDLIDRMKQELFAGSDEATHRSYERFFEHNDYTDCAQLFRGSVGPEHYFEFLQSQFKVQDEDASRLTPSHAELVRLPIPELFTTNYDELIELTFTKAGGAEIAVSVTAEEFRAHQPAHPDRHLIKLHGTISRPETIVLTRDDYAASRKSRTEMFDHLAHEVHYASFLFVGFSLSDPNFNLIRDDARLAMGDDMPASYLAQERPDPVVRGYLDSLGVRTIALESWNAMPLLLNAINPA